MNISGKLIEIIEVIEIVRNLKDFQPTLLPVMQPVDYLSSISKLIG